MSRFLQLVKNENSQIQRVSINYDRKIKVNKRL